MIVWLLVGCGLFGAPEARFQAGELPLVDHAFPIASRTWFVAVREPDPGELTPELCQALFPTGSLGDVFLDPAAQTEAVHQAFDDGLLGWGVLELAPGRVTFAGQELDPSAWADLSKGWTGGLAGDGLRKPLEASYHATVSVSHGCGAFHQPRVLIAARQDLPMGAVLASAYQVLQAQFTSVDLLVAEKPGPKAAPAPPGEIGLTLLVGSETVTIQRAGGTERVAAPGELGERITSLLRPEERVGCGMIIPRTGASWGATARAFDGFVGAGAFKVALGAPIEAEPEAPTTTATGPVGPASPLTWVSTVPVFPIYSAVPFSPDQGICGDGTQEFRAIERIAPVDPLGEGLNDEAFQRALDAAMESTKAPDPPAP